MQDGDRLTPENASAMERMTIARLKHVEVLNRLGQALSHCAADRSTFSEVIEQLREILGIPTITLWLLGPRRPMLGLEACSRSAKESPDADWLAFDKELAFWQKENVRQLVFHSPREAPAELQNRPLPPGEIISLPILYREASLQGVLNLYGSGETRLLDASWDEEARFELLRGVAGQISIFAENRTLEASSLLVREIHHRVKNNLQVVASLLRMQMRRLDRISPEKALQDSIERIQTIAAVHERLSRADIGRLDLADLLRQLADSLTSDEAAGVNVRVCAHGDPVMLDSRDATAAALVANELLQNAILHGATEDGGGEVEVSLYSSADRIRLEVQDHGAGLPPGFDFERDNNLGLTIVSTLVTEVLRGEFGFQSGGGTLAWVSFPGEAVAAATTGAGT